MGQIVLEPILIEALLACPACREPLYRITPAGEEVVCGGTWLQDGDSIPGLWQRLSNEQKTPDGFDYELLVGTCRCCGGLYYVIEAMFVDARVADDPELTYRWFEDHVADMSGIGAVYYSARAPGRGAQAWHLKEVKTFNGPAHVHTFGPFALDEPDKVIGSHGVCACEANIGMGAWGVASDLLYTLWDDLRALTRSRKGGSFARS